MSTPRTTSKLRLTRRGRVVLLSLVVAPVMAAAIVIALSGGGAFATGSGPGSVPGSGSVQRAAPGTLQTELVSFTYITVAPGHSLWDVAQGIAPHADPRDVIADIMSLNRLQGDSVQPGQRLALPSGY